MASFLQGIAMGAAQEGTRLIRSTARVKAEKEAAKLKSEADIAGKLTVLGEKQKGDIDLQKLRNKGLFGVARLKRVATKLQADKESFFGGGPLAPTMNALYANLAGAKRTPLNFEMFAQTTNSMLGDTRIAALIKKDPRIKDRITEMLGQTMTIRVREAFKNGVTLTEAFHDLPNVKAFMAGHIAAAAERNIKEQNKRNPGSDTTVTNKGTGLVIGSKPNDAKNSQNAYDKARADDGKFTHIDSQSAALLTGASAVPSNRRELSVANSNNVRTTILDFENIKLGRSNSSISSATWKEVGNSYGQIIMDGLGGDLAQGIINLGSGFSTEVRGRAGSKDVRTVIEDKSSPGTQAAIDDALATQKLTMTSLIALSDSYRKLSHVPGGYSLGFLGKVLVSITRWKREIAGLAEALDVAKNITDIGLSTEQTPESALAAAKVIADKFGEDKVDSIIREMQKRAGLADSLIKNTPNISNADRALQLSSQIAARQTTLVFSLVKSIQKGDKVSNEDFRLMKSSLEGGSEIGNVGLRITPLRVILEEILTRRVQTAEDSQKLISKDRHEFITAAMPHILAKMHGEGATKFDHIINRALKLIPEWFEKGKPKSTVDKHKGLF